jgi:hypothetical protein
MNNVVRFPKERSLAPIKVEFAPLAIAKALGGTGEVIPRPRGQSHYRCRCPLCGGTLRIAAEIACSMVDVEVDCNKGCRPERVVGELIRLGFHQFRDVRWA